VLVITNEKNVSLFTTGLCSDKLGTISDDAKRALFPHVDVLPLSKNMPSMTDGRQGNYEMQLRDPRRTIRLQ